MIKISKIHARLHKTILGRLYPAKHKAAEQPLPVIPSSDIHDDGPKGKPMKRVAFMSRPAVQSHPFGPEDVLISISDSGMEPPVLKYQPLEVLALAFSDSVTEKEVHELGWRKMDHEDGKKVVEFVLKHTDAPNIIVHCNLGESRSKGAALAISEITDRIAFHVCDRGRITQHEEKQYDFYNRRVYELILMEHMRRDT